MINGYFPQGESRDHPIKFPAKAQFYQNLQNYLETELKRDNPVLIMGDMNISPTDLDIGIGEENRKRWLRTGKCSFLPEEREWMDRLMSWGLVDTFRHANPQTADRFSWFDYRSKGFDDNRGLRIDLLLASQPLAECCVETGIDYEIRSMEKPSDHAPAANLAALLAQTGSGELTLRKINKLSVMICCLPSFVIPSLRF